MTALNMGDPVTTTHRVLEQELLKRLEWFCETAGLEFPKEAWPKDDRKAYFLLGVCATEDMKNLTFYERLARRARRMLHLVVPKSTLKGRITTRSCTTTFGLPRRLTLARATSSRLWVNLSPVVTRPLDKLNHCRSR